MSRAQFEAALAALCDPDGTGSSPQLAAAAFRSGSADLMHLRRPREAFIARSTSEIPDDRDGGGVFVLHLRDVTRETEVDRMKSEFLAVAAHELRTPMSSVHGFAELLMMRAYDAKTTRTIASTIHRQSGALVTMVNELLDLARIEAGKGRDFDIRPIVLAAAVNEVVAGLKMPGDSRKVRVGGIRAGLEVMADNEKLRLALTNVLSNAFKYSRGVGEIRISIEYRGTRSARPMAGIRVSDQGIGMTPEQLSRVFERFYRADPSGAISGTGLGMTLVKDILELMGGSVDVTSVPGQGTEVTLWLQVARQRA